MAQAQKHRSIFDVVYAVNLGRLASQERDFQRMNSMAVRSVAQNATVITAGAVRNAASGLLPFIGAKDQRKRRGRR